MQQTKYLGMIITKNMNYLEKHKKERLNNVKQLANMTYSVTARSCDRLLVGKG